jgi:hypothetical protein
MFYPFLSNLKHDSNTNITILLRVLNYLRVEEAKRSRDLPRILHLQLDGGSENKNRYMLGFIAMLVYCKVFDLVRGATVTWFVIYQLIN